MEQTKVCFKCNTEKPISDFYKHPRMQDGHVNKCKICNKKDVSDNYFKKIDSIEFVEKERKRGREKYHRLKYVERTYYKKSYSSLTKDVGKYLKRRGYDLENKECHHWNYNLKYDVFIIKRRAHKLIHKNIKYNEELNCFITSDGDILNTAEKHFKYILKTFSENNVNYEIEYHQIKN